MNMKHMRLLSKIAFHVCTGIMVVQLLLHPENLSRASFFGILAIINYLYYLDSALTER